MKEAPLHCLEPQRLKALEEYKILDTKAEDSFDELTQLASEICEAPISLISLVDPDRQWFKSTVGLDAESTPRSIAFCSHAILQDDIFEITNALHDERFHDNPLVTGAPNIRFYAGAPLKTPDDLPIGTLCVISDQPKKLTEHQKKALFILAKQVVTQLELRKKTQTLEQTSKYKTDFLSNISHEIRTPLNAIVGFCELLQENSETYLNNDKAREYVQNIDHSGHHLLSIINSVLDLSKIEAGKMELNTSKFKVDKLLQQIVGILSPKANQKHITITVDSDKVSESEVCLDRNKLSQVLINLLGNAVKFTPEHKSIAIECETINNHLNISISDEGIGIRQDELSEIFDKYKQVGNNSSEGTGLGLSISKGLVELMSGQIELTSKSNVGTKVSISLPYTLACPAQVELNNTNITLSDMNVLVVEDNPINQKLISEMLNSLDVSVSILDNGEDALLLKNFSDYDVVLMDINLPGADGITVTEQLKQQGVTCPVIALTADVFVDNEKRSLFNDYLTKPVSKRQLQAALTPYLNK
ncbi:MAG: response regulator [Gammaproteobacteria bacterium]|nr:response regulator [Gammaproteobacteria bacterium]